MYKIAAGLQGAAAAHNAAPVLGWLVGSCGAGHVLGRLLPLPMVGREDKQ